jgi:catechol 2,3-dioxygenase-like lactoylglutathione lyase family enzyme
VFIKDIVINCRDLDRQVGFWSALLARPVAARIGPYVWLERRDGVGLGFQQVAELTARKNRLHLDLGSADPAAEQQWVERLGGRRLPGYEAGGFLVMADPEGNEFCIIPAGPFDLDDEGRASYLIDPDT